MSKIRSDYYVGLLNLGKYFRFFKIHYLIRKKNIKLITVSNIGFIPDNKNFVTFKFWYYLRDLFRRHFVFKLFKFKFEYGKICKYNLKFFAYFK